jgi:organic radical activating enzyme
MKEARYKVTEIFHSIPGEGPQAGMPMVFVRFSGCNLRCSFCDTRHDVSEELTANEILGRVEAAWDKVGRTEGERPVCLTGGEPTLQVTSELLETLWPKHTIYMETNGTRRIPGATSYYSGITVSPKKPMRADQRWDFSCHRASLKVVFDITNPALEKIISTWGELSWDHKFIQPVYRGKKPIDMLMVLGFLAENPDWRLSLQTHKMIGLR